MPQQEAAALELQKQAAPLSLAEPKCFSLQVGCDLPQHKVSSSRHHTHNNTETQGGGKRNQTANPCLRKSLKTMELDFS